MGKSKENGFRILYEAIDRMNVEDKGEPELDRVRDMCVDLFRRCLPSLDSTDPVLRLMSEFPMMKDGVCLLIAIPDMLFSGRCVWDGLNPTGQGCETDTP